MKKIFLSLSIALLSLFAFSQPYLPIYGSAKIYGDSISLGGKLKLYVKGDSVIISGDTKEFVIRDSTLLEIIQKHAGTWQLNDTIFFEGSNGYIAAPNTSTIVVNPNGGAKEFIFSIVTGSDPRISGLESLWFGGVNACLKGFRNDSTTVAGDTAYAWSAKAIRDYVAEHGGGGSGVVSEATSGGSFAIFRTKDTIIQAHTLPGWSLTSMYGVGVGTNSENAWISGAPLMGGFVELRGESSAMDSFRLVYEGISTDEDRILGLSKTGKVKSVNLPQGVQIEVTTETLVSGADSVDVLTIPETLAGMNLIKLEAYPGSVAGDRTMSVVAYRNRSGTVTTMTSAGASFSANATINTTYDDVARGDKIFIGQTFTGGTTDPVGLKVQLTFQKP